MSVLSEILSDVTEPAILALRSSTFECKFGQYTLSVRNPIKKKSNRDKSGERGGRDIGRVLTALDSFVSH